MTLLFLLQLFYHLPWKRTILLPSIKCTTMSMLVERPDDGKKEGHFLNHFSSSIFPTLCKTHCKKYFLCPKFNIGNLRSQFFNYWAQLQWSLRIFECLVYLDDLNFRAKKSWFCVIAKSLIIEFCRTLTIFRVKIHILNFVDFPNN